MDTVRAPGPLARLARRRGLVRSPLRRTTDHVEGVTLVLLMLSALVVVPLAVAMAMAVYHRDAADAATAAAERTPVNAVLASDPALELPPSEQRGTQPEATALVRWQLPDGRGGSEQVPVAADRRAGDQLLIWVDRMGKRVDPPRSPGETRTAALAVGVDLLLVGWVLLAVLWWITCSVLSRINTTRWDAQWARIGPRWSRRSWQ
ncbi:MAG: Rv1733c family protein [Pseudonocardiaceae bacterium]